MATYRNVLIAAVVLVLAFSARAEPGERVALVIGNSLYPKAPLANPAKDARDMTSLLRQAGFAVEQHLDTSKAQLTEAVSRFGATIRDPKVKFALFYYAGHGLQQDWRNYLVPISADIRSPADVKNKTVDVSELLAYMEQATGRSFLVILDACRDDPFAGNYRPPLKGLSQFDAPVGSLLAYATAPGSVAQDGDGENGLYTSNLLREFAVRGARLEDAFKRVRLNVRLASQGLQVPWESTSLEEDVYLFPPTRLKLTDAEQDQELEQEINRWVRVRSSKDLQQLTAFIRDYPSGSVSELAQARLNRLLAAQERQKAQPVQIAAAPTTTISRDTQIRDEAASQQAAQAEAARLTALRAEQAREEAAAVAARQQEVARAETVRQQEFARTEAARAVAAAQAERAAQQQRELAQARQQEIERLELALLAAERERVAARPATEVAATTRTEPAGGAANPATVFAATPYFKGYQEHRRSYQTGDFYNYQVIDVFTKASKPLALQVTAIDVDGDRVEYNNGEYLSDTMGNTIANPRGGFSTPRQFYPAELFVGKKWRTMFKQSRPGGIVYTYRYDLKVVGRETIVVPAGTFDTFKIEARGFNMQLNARLERNIWVAPGVSGDIAHEILVRLRNGAIEQNDRQELASFRQAGQRTATR